LVPRLVICIWMACVAPLPSVTMVITALTPITMPRMVRKERSMLRRTERKASMKTLNSIRRSLRAAWGRRGDRVRVGDVAGDAAVDEMHHAPRIGRHVGLVRDHQHGDAVVAVQRQQQAHDLVAALGVEVAGGFVGQHHRRLGDDGAGDGHPLLLPADSSAGVCCSQPPKPTDCKALAAAAATHGGTVAAIQQRQFHVLLRRGARQQVEALEHEAQIAAAQPRPLVARQRLDMRALEQVLPGGVCPGSRGCSSPSTCPSRWAP
jgi:hypothetical protein